MNLCILYNIIDFFYIYYIFKKIENICSIVIFDMRVKLSTDLRLLVCEWILKNIKCDEGLRNCFSTTRNDEYGMKLFIKRAMENDICMGVEALYALSHIFGSPLHIHYANGVVSKYFENYRDDPIVCYYDWDVCVVKSLGIINRS
jgi:hypothetical protein